MKTLISLFFVAALLASFPVTSKEVDNPYLKCVAQTKDQDACLDKVGRDHWTPYKSPDDCIIVKETLETAEKSNWKFSYKILFFNERCKSLRQPHFERKSREP
ncbi:MAG: hypothetical protein WD823_00140 [Sulfuricaulis sp.]|uniref:hypothetical protein n=1 Tax=Sulfuricaulis sp. TaxID=2003553 RepID=UPI0034A55294